MLLTISTTHKPATDLGFLLHKHPDRVQAFPISCGQAQVFYPEASEEKCTAALLLDVDPIGLIRRNKGFHGEGFLLRHYVNDRPYVASSFMSHAIAKVFSSALNGQSQSRPELVERPLPFEVTIAALQCKGGKRVLEKLFLPLGYELTITRFPLDVTFPEWGDSSYFRLSLKHTISLQELLSHLYVLIPVMDNEKHYWIGRHEVEKLLEKGQGWLSAHPEKEYITKRYLRYIGSLTRQALAQLTEEEGGNEEIEEEVEQEQSLERTLSLNEQRLTQVLEQLKQSGATSVLDLGCGEGKLLRLLLRQKQFERILGMDVSFRALEHAKERLHYNEMAPKQRQRIELLHGSLMYRDKRLEGFDAVAVVEVIEHFDAARLSAFERVVFECAKPQTIVLSTPNIEYNVKFESLPAGKSRHHDHRFEWTRREFQDWAQGICKKYDYNVAFFPVGEEDEMLGAPTQMGVFTRTTGVGN